MRYIERKNKIINDKYTEYVYEAFDIQDKEETSVKIPINFGECKMFDWNIGVIYGGSGTGKTTLLKEFGALTTDQFDEHKPLISNFKWLEPKEATFLLSAMGLASVPTWLRPFSLLSNGEQYRASLAYKVGKAKEGDTILIDEFTSVVDRDVAKAMSNALQKYIRRNNKKIILASCHFDIMEWLLPDWTYSPLKGRIERASCRRQRPKIELQVFRCRYEAWNIFKQHHYLTLDLNKASKCFLATWNDKPVAFIAVLPLPSGYVKNSFRGSRTVVLPDFQGLGIGYYFSNYIASLYKKNGCRYFVKTSNPALGEKRLNSNNWRETSKSRRNFSDKAKKDMSKNKMGFNNKDMFYAFEYIGIIDNVIENDLKMLNFNSDAYKEVAQNQISMF